jgi:hypothetical protein
VLLVVVGTVIGVGAAVRRSEPYGALFKVFANDTSAGSSCATRRAVPLIVLGSRVCFAAGVALATRRGAACVVIALAIVAFLPVWRVGYLPDSVAPNDIPRTGTMQPTLCNATVTRPRSRSPEPLFRLSWGNTIGR